MLPGLPGRVSHVKTLETAFGGYDHNAVTRDGYLYDMKNLSGAFYPALSPRRGRTLVRTIEKPNGLFSHGRLCWVDGTGFYYDGVKKGDVEDSVKSFARLGAYLLIFPDKAYYNIETDTFGQLEASWTGSASITHYTYDAGSGEAEEVYQGNAISGGTAFPFEAGEAVFLSGCGEGNCRSAVIREVREDGKLLVFSNNTFIEEIVSSLTIRRKTPDMDFLCENENRVWGCRGSEIYASALGNPFRWYNYEGLATDSYAASTGAEGDFSGAASFLGYAVFFKPDAIYKVYGAKPSNFQVMRSAVSGILPGCGASAAVAGETLFYLSRTGVVSYSGGIPASVAGAFGVDAYDGAVGGSDGRRYYVSLRSGEAWTLFCYDTRTGLWHKEDDTHALAFACQDGVLYLLDARDNGLYSVGTGEYTDVEWMAETGDFYGNGLDKSGLVRLQIRLETGEKSLVKVELQFDSDGLWRPVRQISSTRKRVVTVPIVPRRCGQFRLRLRGKGACLLLGITREFYRGSASV